ncbi:MAG: 30S ribosomal protein S11 [Parcubacteria group bacterium]|nr:30S ribosomal protein S11 [Parcubacteria group bacterium]
MGKKRTVQKKGGGFDAALKARALSRTARRKVGSGTLYIEATYNNTKCVLADKSGNTLAWSSSGNLGFKGTKKGTPFAAAKVGELMGERAQQVGMQDVAVSIKGVGAGRESALRSFAAKGVSISAIRDQTPVPFNGPRPPKKRRV